MDATPERGLGIYLLGRFHVTVDGYPIEDAAWRRERAATLIKLLALAPQHQLHREEVVETLWPDSAPGAGNNSLHQVIHVARRILGSGGSVTPHRLQLQQEMVSLSATGPLWIDADAFEHAAARARQGRDAPALESALALYQGDLLPDSRYEEWTVTRRGTLQRVYVETLLDLADIQAAAREFGKAIATYRRVLDTDPAHEDAHAGLMRVHALSGQRYSALRQYRLLQETLAEELGAEPQPATMRLLEDIAHGMLSSLAGKGDSPGSVSTSAGSTLSMTRLPLETNSFVGRSRDVAEVCALLDSTRVLTLVGAGGCGKTRLAVHVASAVRAADPIDIPFVDLSGISQPSLVPQAVAAALGVVEQWGRPIIETVIERLRTQRLVVLLDNCEHLIDACARFAQTLVESCPQVRVLCTSREPLRIPGELVWRVSSLGLPDPHRMPATETLLECESVRLFCDRASAVVGTFQLTDANAGSIAQICHRLDGIPLALELAAARVSVLSPEQIVSRLDDCFVLLSQGSRTAMSRQQTLKALLDWSYDLLSEDERRLFRRLGVFAGTFHLPALEAIADSGGLSAGQVLDLLQSLVDKSLVVAVSGEGTVRYRLLEPIRQYAALQLEAAGEAREFSSRHVNWYLEHARLADEALWGTGHQSAVTDLERERENMRAALGWCTTHDQMRGLELAHTQWQFWLLRGYLSEGRRWFEQLLDGHFEPHAAPARGMLDAWGLATRQGYYGATSTAKVDAGIDIYRGLGDLAGLAQAIHERGIQAYMRGRYAQARAFFEESHTLAASIESTSARARAIYALSIISWVQGAYEEAHVGMEVALQLFRACPASELVSTSFLNVGLFESPYGPIERALTVQEETWVLLRRIEAPVAIGYTLANLGNIARLQGRLIEAQHYLDESIATFRALGDNAGLSQAWGQKGNALRRAGNESAARELLEQSLALRREIGDRRGAGRTLNNLGMLAVEAGDTDSATNVFSENMSLFVEMGDKPGMTSTFENQGHLALLTGDYTRAHTAYKHALALAYDMGGLYRNVGYNLRHRGLAEMAQGDETAARTSFLASRDFFVEMGDVVGIATLDHLLLQTTRR